MSTWLASRRRRFVTIPGVVLMAGGLTVTAPVWIPVAAVYDLARARPRLPIARLLGFGLVWSWLESIGVTIAAGLWLTGQSSNRTAHYALQRWWAARLVNGLQVLCGLRIEVEGAEALAPGPLVILGRHSSLADSLLPAWLLGRAGKMSPRYVMKRELLADPCLDIVGNRVPTFFVDRAARDTGPELDGIEQLARHMATRDAAVIFPEGAVGDAGRRWRAMVKLVGRDPARGTRLAPLLHLMPPRAKGTMALLRGAPEADVVLMAHVGLEGLSNVANAAQHIPLTAPVRVRLQRIPRAEVPPECDFEAWLDDKWLEMDLWIEETLTPSERAEVIGLAAAFDAGAAVSGVLERARSGRAVSGEVMLAAAGSIVVIMLVTWLVSLAMHDASIVDPIWPLGFVVIAWVVRAVADGDPARGWLLVAMVTIWGLRLSAHLAWRKRGQPEDFRYQAMRKHWGPRFPIISLVTVFALQGGLMWIVSLPVQLGQVPDSPGLGPLAAVGVLVWIIGFAFETIGDAELTSFKSDPASAGQVMDRGLWRYTRHPNYFGDACVWWGIALVAAESGLGAVGLIGALVMTVLLRRVSGVPMLERSMAKRRPGYTEYVARTSPFVPRPPRAG